MRRSRYASVERQGAFLLKVTVWVYLPIVLIYGLLGLQDAALTEVLLQDPNMRLAHTLEAPPGARYYRGALSHLGVLLWWSAAVVGALTYAVLRVGPTSEQRATAAFFLCFAGFSALLALDDLFMLHEGVLPHHLGIPEWLVFILYGRAALLLGVGFGRFVLRSDAGLLALALGFFALSILVDEGLLLFLNGVAQGQRTVLEEAAKLLGVVSWSLFLWRAATAQLRGGAASPKRLEEPGPTCPLAPTDAALENRSNPEPVLTAPGTVKV